MIVSNRGPISFDVTSDGVRPVKSGGGLAGALRPLLARGAKWLAFAMSEADKAATADGQVARHSPGTHLVTIDAASYELAYNVVANQHMWFAHHGLAFDAPGSESENATTNSGWATAWEAFERYNLAMAEAVAATAPPDAAILIQDYHLCLVASALRETRPDLRLVHFSHTPFVGPHEDFLPPPATKRVLEAMSAHHACGFHSHRWADALTGTSRLHGFEPPHTFVSSLAPDLDALTTVATADACRRALHELHSEIGDRLVITRVDRIEPSKNIELGFAAYDKLLNNRPDIHGEVVFCAYVYPSRESLTRYRELKSTIERQVAGINAKHRQPGWDPIVLDMSDDLAGAFAALRRYDVLLVNPLRDGLNLVALEGPMVNDRAGQLVLSTEAGAHDVMGDFAFSIDPTDIVATADAMGRALELGPEARQTRAASLHKMAGSRTPQDWLEDQLEQAG